MTTMLDRKKIKSANRVLEIFEYFDRDHSSATVMEIARAYGYPQSSTSELLNCLVELGYLRRNRNARTYSPTAKVSLLGSWVQPRLFREGKLLPMMDELAEESGGTILLVGTAGLGVETLQAVVPGDAEAHPEPTSLLHCATGRLLLSTFDRGHIRKLVHRLNAENWPNDFVRCDELLVEIDRIRSQAYAVDASVGEGRARQCAVLLPQVGIDEPLALAISVGAGDGRGVEVHVRALRNAIAKWLGPVLAHHRSSDAPLLRQAH